MWLTNYQTVSVHIVNPFVISLATGIHVELPLHAQIVRPIQAPGMTSDVRCLAIAIDHQRHVSVLVICSVSSLVPLDMVPNVGTELGQEIDECILCPEASSQDLPEPCTIIALASDHIVMAVDKLEGVELQSLSGSLGVAVHVEIEIPEKIVHAVICASFWKNRAFAHAPELKNSVLEPSREGELWYSASQ